MERVIFFRLAALLARQRLYIDYTAAADSRRLPARFFWGNIGSLLPQDFRERERERCKERERAELGRRGLSRRLSSPAAQRKEMVRGESEDAGWMLAGGARR
jgi:hypothetical protein